MLSLDTHRFSFAIIGDTHVKPESGDQSAPWKVNELATGRARWIAREIERYNPEFIVHLGDLVHPVPELSTFAEAVTLTKMIFAPSHNKLHVIPGNHDIGDKPNEMMPAKMVRDEWIALHESSFGPSFHTFDRDDCRFVFINDPVMNSGSSLETRQRAWLEETLASTDGRRLFLFMHYPLFLLDPGEPGHYDNIDEPARSDVLGLILKHKAEAVFAGHVHNIFYHRLGTTEFYVMPATSFVRQDFSEMFRVEAAAENGRNDAEKLGFAIVEVHDEGHVVHYLRSYGESLPVDAPSSVAPRSAVGLLPHPKKEHGAPIGVYLRHPWAEVTSLPHNGPMDEFQRKDARNDYPVEALWRLGVRDLHVPLSDLLDERIRSRMAALVTIGHRFTVFCFGVPGGPAVTQITRHAHLVDRFECVLPFDKLHSEASAVARFRKAAGRPVLVSPLASSAGEKKIGSRIELFVAHGFRPDQIADIDVLLAEVDPWSIDHVAMRIGLGSDCTKVAATLAAWQERTGYRVDLHLRIAADNPAANVVNDRDILNSVVEFYVAALGYPGLGMVVDPFVDIDRGYFVRHGLIDRRGNLRIAGLALEAMGAYLGRRGNAFHIVKTTVEGGVTLSVVQDRTAALILLPRDGATLQVPPAVTSAGSPPTMLAVPLDKPWVIDPGLGQALSSDAELPKHVSSPVMLIGNIETKGVSSGLVRA